MEGSKLHYMERFDDIAIPLSWPDQTARGDEKWFLFLKKIGLVKNLNFRIGHAAIVLIERKTGQVLYFDFGRYITPRGYGRARSARSDPRLSMEIRGRFGEKGELLNLEEILAALKKKESATHGGGRLLCSLGADISFHRGVQFAEHLVDQGPILYGTLAANNNNCSRYVAQILVAAMPKKDPRIARILYPEFIKASPTSNVVNGTFSDHIFCYLDGTLERWSMTRLRSFRFHLRQLYANFSTKQSLQLGDDSRPGHTAQPGIHPGIPSHAQWLGGIGEGRWFVLDCMAGEFRISRLDEEGVPEYRVICRPDGDFDPEREYSFTFDVHFSKHVLRQSQQTIAFYTQSYDIADELDINLNTYNYFK